MRSSKIYQKVIQTFAVVCMLLVFSLHSAIAYDTDELISLLSSYHTTFDELLAETGYSKLGHLNSLINFFMLSLKTGSMSNLDKFDETMEIFKAQAEEDGQHSASNTSNRTSGEEGSRPGRISSRIYFTIK